MPNWVGVLGMGLIYGKWLERERKRGSAQTQAERGSGGVITVIGCIAGIASGSRRVVSRRVVSRRVVPRIVGSNVPRIPSVTQPGGAVPSPCKYASDISVIYKSLRDSYVASPPSYSLPSFMRPQTLPELASKPKTSTELGSRRMYKNCYWNIME